MVSRTDILDFDKKYGFVQVPNVLVENLGKLGLSGNEFTFLVIIRMFARQKDCAFPSLKTLTKISGLSMQTVINVIKSLENKGYLVIKRSSHQNNLYSFKPLNDILEKIINNNLNGILKNFEYPTQKIRVSLLKKLESNNKHIKNKHMKTHTKKEKDDVVCENEIEKIKKSKTFQNIEPAIIERIIGKNGKAAGIAAAYIEKTFSGQIIRNPAGLLIKTLESGLYSELPESNIASIKAEIEKLNGKYRGFKVYENEKIAEISNIGGRIAFRTNDITKDITVTPAKSSAEFENYLKKINSS